MEWEVYELSVKETYAEVEAGKLKLLGSSRLKKFAARVLIDGKVGFASAESERKAIEMAEKLAKVSGEKLDDFPVEKPAKVSGIYDRRVEDLTPEFLREELERLQNVAVARISHSVSEVKIRNSFGLDVEEKSTSSSLLVEVVTEGSGYWYEETRSLELDIEGCVERAKQLAEISARARKIEKGVYDVVLSPLAVDQLFSNTIYAALSAENVVKGRSPLKIGEYLGELKMIDDATLSGGLNSCSFDDEGVAAKRKVLVDGEVKSFLTDWKHSKTFGVTGNGFREEVTLPPSPSPTNVVVETKKCDAEDAIYVHQFIGAHTANPVSGDFSYECHHATLNDEPVRLMVYGNVYELLRNLEGRVGEVEQHGNTVSAALRFRDVRVV
ncbi:MAG: TldD/PmbA family protein [Archaeoglobaceae archaeon]